MLKTQKSGGGHSLAATHSPLQPDPNESPSHFTPQSASLTMTLPEAAKALGIGESLARDLARTGRLPIVRLGRRVLVRRQTLERLLVEAEQDGAVIP